MNIKNHFIQNLDRAFDKSYQFITDSIFEYSEISETPLTILDIGCGWRLRTKEFLSKVDSEKIKEVHGIDIVNPEKIPDKGIVYKQMNLENADLPYRSGMFDVVICSQIIEHLTIKDKTLEESHRVLKRTDCS